MSYHADVKQYIRIYDMGMKRGCQACSAAFRHGSCPGEGRGRGTHRESSGSSSAWSRQLDLPKARKHLRQCSADPGRPPKDRLTSSKLHLQVYPQAAHDEALIKPSSDQALREKAVRVEIVSDIPSESTFSRAFRRVRQHPTFPTRFMECS